MRPCYEEVVFFVFNDPATTEIYTLSLHHALPISRSRVTLELELVGHGIGKLLVPLIARSEEHTSELQSRRDLACRLRLEKKKGWCRLPEAEVDPQRQGGYELRQPNL